MLKNWINRTWLVGMGLILSAPLWAQAYGKASVIESYVGRTAAVPLIKPSWGNFMLHAETLNKLYSQRSYQAIWVDSNGKPTAMASMLRAILLAADRHGLNPADYWDADVENLYRASASNPRNWITFELATSEALIRYVTHMSVGRFDPEQIDSDIKYKAKVFSEYSELNAAVSYGPQSMPSALDSFAPNYQTHYSDLMEMLAKLKKIKAEGSWTELPAAGAVLKLGVKNPLIPKLRARLRAMGYNVSDAGGQVFDSEFNEALKSFQQLNGMTPDGIIGSSSSEVLRALNVGIAQRMTQVEVNMERLRWLPRNVEKRHLFVNLGMTEVRVFDENGDFVFTFNSVNGQSFRRTPSMRDMITYVNLNPYWTAPRSITIKDKLKELRTQGRKYLDDHDMILMDEATDRPVSDYELDYVIDWRNLTPKNFNYYIKQKPGIKNALGVVKFPLQNPWSIYLHDTNAPELFKEKERHQSSGCIRLEQALDLALYLIQGQSTRIKGKITGSIYNMTWNETTLSEVLANKYSPVANEDFWDISVTIKKPMPVYTLYLTARLSDGGAMRFVEDVYGQDKRVEMAIKNSRKKGEIF